MHSSSKQSNGVPCPSYINQSSESEAGLPLYLPSSVHVIAVNKASYSLLIMTRNRKGTLTKTMAKLYTIITAN